MSDFDEMKQQRDTWALAAEVCAEKVFPMSYAGLPNDPGTLFEAGIAAAYAIAEAYGEDWREELEGKP